MIYFTFGLIIGSFCNVIAIRMVLNVDFLFSRSVCSCCSKKLKWYNMIPLVSFILLKGRCTFCHCKISNRYWVVELISGILAFLCFSHFDTFLQSILMYLIYMILLVLALIDIDTLLVYSKPFYCLVSVVIFYVTIFKIEIPKLMIGSLLVLFLFVLSKLIKNSIGLGDVEVLLVLLFVVDVDIYLLFILSILISTIYILFLKYKKNDIISVAFCPFIFVGFVLTTLYSSEIINMYMKLYF